MKSLRVTLLICFYLIVPKIAFGGSPESVLRELAKNYAPGDMVYWLDVDINGDGINDLLVTSSNASNEEDRRDFEWWVYIGNADGTYTRLDGLPVPRNGETPVSQGTVTIRLERYWVGLIPELGKRGLLHLVCGTGGHAKCQLSAVLLEKGKFTEIPVGKAVNAEANFEKLQARFTGAGVPATRSSKASDLR